MSGEMHPVVEEMHGVSGEIGVPDETPHLTERLVDKMRVFVGSFGEIAEAAASQAAGVLRGAIQSRGTANAMFATGNSQLAFLDTLVDKTRGIDWSRVIVFHMDEYVGVGPDHPAGFQRYIRERITDQVSLLEAHYLRGDSEDPEAEAKRYAAMLKTKPLDLCCLGIGENGHLAFNDPPAADFDDPVDVKVVELDEACRDQQVGEGHFPSAADVPSHAITVTIPALLRAREVIGVVPEARKAQAVKAALTGPVTTECPASVLRTRDNVTLYLDRESASLSNL